MIARLRPLAFFVIALAAVPWLPLYVERTMTRSMVIGHAGDRIAFGWKLRTLAGFWDDYSYLRPEQSPPLYMAINLGLAFWYAVALALGIEIIVRRIRAAKR